MENPNPTYVIEHFGLELRVTVTHIFNEGQQLTFTVMLPSGQETLANLHEMSFAKLRSLLSLLQP